MTSVAMSSAGAGWFGRGRGRDGHVVEGGGGALAVQIVKDSCVFPFLESQARTCPPTHVKRTGMNDGHDA